MKKTLKIAAVILAIALICGVLYFTNGFVGNPISKYLVEKNSEQYIAENYADLNLTSEIGFDFKSTRYYINLKSETVEDLHFTLYYNLNGSLSRDLYENNITEGWNVMTRISRDYRNEADDLFEVLKEQELFIGAEPLHASANLVSKVEVEDRAAEDLREGGIDGRTLELDKVYDVGEVGKVGGALDVRVSFADGDQSFERGAEALRVIKETFDEAEIGFYYISFGIYNDEGNLAYHIEFFPYSEIESEDLADKIEKAYEENPNKDIY